MEQTRTTGMSGSVGSMCAALSVLVSAGTVFAAGEGPTPELYQRGVMQERHVAHLYFNAATGEAVASLVDGAVRPADAGASVEVWISDNGLPCAEFGQTIGTSGVMDDPNCTTCFDSTATGGIFLDWGDIAPDTVVDCVGIGWSTQHLDTDTDSDGIGDGVEGFGATWAWFDADDGFDSSATRAALTGFTLFNLPGLIGTFDPNLLAVYTATVDLAGSFSSSIAFEIGDTDSVDGSGTGIFNPGAGADLDSDGLADFSYAKQYIQPGTFDFDSDGVLDGDPNAAAIAGWSVALPPGETVDNGDGTYTYVPDPAPAGQGIEDAFDFFIDFNDDGVWEPIGTFFFGGFTCDANGDGVPGDVVPFTQFQMSLYGPDGGGVCCPADVFPLSDPGQSICANGDGVLNFFDISAYIGLFNDGDTRVDVAAPFGTINFFDLSAFLSSYNAGCP